MKNLFPAFMLASMLAVSAVSAASAKQAEADKHAFALGYSLEFTSQTGARFVDDVRKLNGMTDEDEAAEELRLASQSDTVRSCERNGVLSSLREYRAIGGSKVIEDWLLHTSGLLAIAPKPSKAADRDDPVQVKTVLATIDEIADLTAGTRDALPGITAAVKIDTGVSGLWAFKAGQLMADIASWPEDDKAPDTRRIRALLASAPKSADASLKRQLKALLPEDQPVALKPGDGNLGSLAPSAATWNRAAADTCRSFLAAFGCSDLPKKLAQS